MTLEIHFSVTLDPDLMARSWMGLAKLLHSVCLSFLICPKGLLGGRKPAFSRPPGSAGPFLPWPTEDTAFET